MNFNWQHRTPLMSVCNDDAGTQQLCLDLAMYDGNTRQIADQIAAAPFPILDSLSEPPEGDMMLDQCRDLWPDKTILANINVGLCARPADELRQAVIDKRRRAGKKAFAFEISEDTPENWEASIPIVLQTLAQLD